MKFLRSLLSQCFSFVTMVETVIMLVEVSYGWFCEFCWVRVAIRDEFVGFLGRLFVGK